MGRVILLDVDGTINIVSETPRKTHPDAQLAEVTAAVGYAKIIYSPTITESLFHVLEGKEVFWLTAWRNKTKLLPDLICSPAHWGWLRNQQHPSSLWWKIDVIEHQILSHYDEVLWVDDDAAEEKFHPEEQLWLQSHPQITVISPEPSTGLTSRDIEKIAQWLQQHD